jgi:hypothetical protein
MLNIGSTRIRLIMTNVPCCETPLSQRSIADASVSAEMSRRLISHASLRDHGRNVQAHREVWRSLRHLYAGQETDFREATMQYTLHHNFSVFIAAIYILTLAG